MTSSDELRRAMGDLVGVPADHVSLFWRGRVALYAILRSLGIGPGDEVIVPAFTCVAVPNAVLYTGAAPVYVDIDERTYTADPAAVATAIGPRTRAVLAQNTFGLSSDLDALSAVAAAHGAVVIDDCTHGLGGTYKGRPTAPRPTPRSSPRNGASRSPPASAASRSPPIRSSRESSARSSARPRSRPCAERVLLGTMLFARERIATPRTLRTGRAVYRAASRAGVVPGSSSQDELEGSAMPGAFLTRMSAFQAGLGSKRLTTLDARVRRRRAIAERYSAWLVAHGRTAAHEPESAHHAFLRYPLRVHEREAFLEKAARSGLDLGDWFHSPLYPISGDLSAWGYRWGSNPVAERVATEIVNLPTDVAPEGRELRAVEDLLQASVDHIV